MAGGRGWREHTDEKGRHWLIIDPTPEHALEQENEALHAQLAARDRLNDDLLKYARGREARVAFLAGRLRRLRAWVKRLPKPAGPHRKAEVGTRRQQQLRAGARAAAAVRAAAAEAARPVPARLRRKMQAEGVRRYGPDGSVEEYIEVKITWIDGAK